MGENPNNHGNLRLSLVGNQTVFDIQNAAGTLEIAQEIRFTGGIRKTGSGTLTLLSSANSYAAGTIIEAGTLKIGDQAKLGASTSTVALTGGQLMYVNSSGLPSSTLPNPVSLGGGAINVSAGQMVLGGAVSGSGALVKTGTGTLAFSGTGTNTYSGGTTISAGVFTFSAVSNLGSGNVTLNGGTLKWNSGNTSDPTSLGLVLSDTVNTLDTGGNANITLGSSISGTGGLNKQGTGNLTLAAADTFSGKTTIAGTITLGHSLALQNSTLNYSTGTLAFGSLTVATLGGLEGTNASALPTGFQLTVGNNNSSGTFSGTLSGTSAGLIKTGTGTLVLAGNNTYGDGTTINAGVLRASGGNAIPNASVVMLANVAGATFDLNGSSETIGGLIGGGTTGGNVTLGTGGALTISNAAASSFPGVISGSGSLTKSGTATLTLAGANTYTGNTTVSGGTLTVTHDEALGHGSTATVSSGATLSLASVSYFSSAPTIHIAGTGVGGGGALVGSGTSFYVGTVYLDGSATVSVASGGDLSLHWVEGSGTLTKAGAGTLTLDDNSFVGAGVSFDVADGALSYATNGGGGSLTVEAGATVNLITGALTNAIEVTVSGNAYPSGIVPVDAYTQTSTGNLHMGIYGQTSFDLIDSFADLTCDGTLTIALSGYSPSLGDSFHILQTSVNGSVVGSFDSIDYTDAPLDSGLAWSYSGGVLSVVSGPPMAPMFMVPEPGVAGLAAGVLLVRRRARRSL